MAARVVRSPVADGSDAKPARRSSAQLLRVLGSASSGMRAPAPKGPTGGARYLANDSTYRAGPQTMSEGADHGDAAVAPQMSDGEGADAALLAHSVALGPGSVTGVASFMAMLRWSAFTVAHVLNETHTATSRIGLLTVLMQLLMVVLDFLSVMQLIINGSLGWPALFSDKEFSPVPWILPSNNPGAFYTVYSIFQFVLWSTFLTAAYAAWSFHRGVFSSFAPAIYMRAVAGVVVTAMYIPALEILLLPFRCDFLLEHLSVSEHHDHAYQGPCSSSFGIALAALSAVALTAFFPFAITVAWLYNDAHPLSQSLLAANTGIHGMLDILSRTLLTALAFFVSSEEPRIVAVVFTLFLAYLEWRTVMELPMYHMSMNILRSAMYAIAVWCSIGAIALSCMLMTESYSSDGSARTAVSYAFLGSLPLITVVGAALPVLRARQLLRKVADVSAVDLSRGTGVAAGTAPRLSHAVGVEPDTTSGDPASSIGALTSMVFVGEGSANGGNALRLFSGGPDEVPLIALLCVHTRSPSTPASEHRANEAALLFPRAALDKADAIYRLGLQAFPDDASVRVAYAHFLATFRKDITAAVNMLALAARCRTIGFWDSFAIFSFGKTLQQEKQSNDLGEDRALDGLGLAAFTQGMMSALTAHADAAGALKDLWTLVATRVSDLSAADVTHAVGSAVSARAKAAAAYASLATRYPNNVRVLRLHAAFMKEIMNDVNAATAMTDRADALEFQSNVPDGESETAGRRSSFAGSVQSASKRSASSAGMSQQSGASGASSQGRRGKKIVNVSQRIVDGLRQQTWWGLIALACVAAGTFTAGYVGLTTYSANADDVNVAGFRRALTMRTTMLARELSLAASPVTGNAAQQVLTQQQLLATINALSRYVSGLYQASKLFDQVRDLYESPSLSVFVYSPGPPPVWRNSSLGLQELGIEFLSNAAVVATSPSTSLEPIAARSYAPLLYLLRNAETTFQAFARAVIMYTDFARGRATVFVSSVAAMLAVAGIVTIVLWCVIFVPSVRRVNRSNGAILTLAKAVKNTSAKRLARKYEKLENSLDALAEEVAGRGDDQDLGEDSDGDSDTSSTGLASGAKGNPLMSSDDGMPSPTPEGDSVLDLTAAGGPFVTPAAAAPPVLVAESKRNAQLLAAASKDSDASEDANGARSPSDHSMHGGADASTARLVENVSEVMGSAVFAAPSKRIHDELAPTPLPGAVDEAPSPQAASAAHADPQSVAGASSSAPHRQQRRQVKVIDRKPRRPSEVMVQYASAGTSAKHRGWRRFCRCISRTLHEQTSVSNLTPLIRSLALQMLVALLVVLTLQATSVGLTVTAINTAESRSADVNYAGFQRGQVQRIAMLTRELAIQDGVMASPQLLTRRLRTSINNLHLFQRALLYGDAALGTQGTQGSSSALDSIYVGPSADAFTITNTTNVYQGMRAFGMQGLTRNFLAAAETIAARYEPYFGPAATLDPSNFTVCGANYTCIMADPTMVLIRDMERRPDMLFATLARAVDVLVADIVTVNTAAISTLIAILCLNEGLLLVLWLFLFRGLFVRLREEASRTDDFKAMLPHWVLAQRGLAAAMSSDAADATPMAH